MKNLLTAVTRRKAAQMPDQLPAPVGLIPEQPMMTKQTYASPMSYIGITRRGTAWVRRVGDTWWKASLAVSALVLFLALAYVVLVGWYFVVFVLFGLFTFPYRLVRRSHRKQEHLQRQQLATMQAMMVQQQRALAQSQQHAGDSESASHADPG